MSNWQDAWRPWEPQRQDDEMLEWGKAIEVARRIERINQRRAELLASPMPKREWKP